MKKISILFLIFLQLTAFSQTETETIKKANDLIANKKYESAFKLLDNFDPNNSKPDIVLLKEDIVLNYFVTSMMHQMFALKDLEKNEDIMDYRGKQGSFSMQMFQVDSILENLIKIHPDNCKLYKGLAEFYFEIHLKYSGRWLKDDNEVFNLMHTNFKKTIDGNCADFHSHYVLGYINLAQEKYKESIPYFLRSIELNKDYATSHYNLAYAYLFTDDRQNALKYAKNSLDLYSDQEYKSDAARMLGQIYTELNDDKNALDSYKLADKINPGNYYNIKSLLNLYVKTGDKEAGETAKTFFNLAPSNPTIYNDLEEIYYNNGKLNELTAFYKSQLPSFNDNDKIRSNLSFFLARAFRQNANDLRDAAGHDLSNNRKEEANKKLEEANKNSKKAIEYYSEVIKINAIDHEAYNNRGNIYMDMNLFDSALIDYRQSIRIEPDYYVGLDNIGAMYARKGMYDSALYYFAESIGKKNDYGPVYNNRAIAYLNTNRFREAIQDWQTYLIYDRDNPDVLNSIGECYRKLGQNQDALKYINMAIQIEPNGFYFLNRSYTYKNLNNIDAARKDAMAAKSAGIKLDQAYAASLGIQ